MLLFAFHGATFLALRTTGELRCRAETTARSLAIPAFVVAGGLSRLDVVVAMDRNDKDLFPPVLPASSGSRALVLPWCSSSPGGRARLRHDRAGASPHSSTLFTSLYPRVMVSEPDFGSSLTVENAVSSPYALKVMSVAALILVPIVLLYQGWTYYVFRKRLGGDTAPS